MLIPMPDPIQSPTVVAPAQVSFTVDDALTIANTIGALAAAVVPGEAALIAAVTGAAALLRNTILPAIKNAHDRNLSIAEQAVLAAESAAERARVGAPQATVS